MEKQKKKNISDFISKWINDVSERGDAVIVWRWALVFISLW